MQVGIVLDRGLGGITKSLGNWLKNVKQTLKTQNETQRIQNTYKRKLRHFLTKLDTKVKGDWGFDEIKLNAQIVIKGRM